jgi:hypothetical protein
MPFGQGASLPGDAGLQVDDPRIRTLPAQVVQGDAPHIIRAGRPSDASVDLFCQAHIVERLPHIAFM